MPPPDSPPIGPRDAASLLDILLSARLARAYVAGKTWEAFVADRQCQDAVVRRLEVLGEAARRVSVGARAALPGLPWRQMVGMRNRMIHEYDRVDLAVVWETVSRHLPPLITALEGVVPPPPADADPA
jgi:uncharacterized protein with HEPN domain